MIKWHCDICGKPTYVNPEIKPLFDEIEEEIPVPKVNLENKTNPVVWEKKKVKKQIPVMHKVKTQNATTGKMEEKEVQKFEDLQPRAYIVQLRVGGETVQKDFCKECLDRVVRPLLKPVWDKFVEMSDK